MNPGAGWHPDPHDPAIDRYWDGQQWTSETRPKIMASASVGDPTAPVTKSRTWPWILGAGVLAAGVLGLVIAGTGGGPDEKTDSVSVVSTTSSAAPTTISRTTTSVTTTTAVSPTATVPEVMETSEVYVPTTQMMPAEPPPSSQRSLEYSCSDADWRDAMGAEGNALCGSTWTPRNQSQPTTQYTPPATTTRGQSTVGTVHPGSYCSTPGAVGVTVSGTPMVCAPGSDGKDRWQSS
ncbi:DUF2510 domain-containing protein [Rhodococcus erythropolis]|nr:DUF2510 domain-containing protein [Rhodococcus erythropolis]